MRGILNGVQALIKQLEKRAVYVHCLNPYFKFVQTKKCDLV